MDNLNIQLKEADINRFLQLTLKAYLSQKKKGNDKIATDILKIGSDHARFLLDFYGIKSHKVYCFSCGKQAKNGPDIESINFAGECLVCNHLRSDHEY